MPVVPTCGCWLSFGAWLSLSSLLGVRCHPFGVRWLAAGRRLPVARLSRCWRVVVVWAAGVVNGGVRWVTWQAGDMAGALLLTLATWACGCRVWFSGGCRGSWVAGVVRGGGGHLWCRGGRAESRWWLWNEERRRVTICDACDFGSRFERAHAPSQICSVPYMYSFVVFIIRSCRVPLNLVVSAFYYKNL